MAPLLIGAVWMAQRSFTKTGMHDPVHMQAMAVLMGLHTASQRLSLNSSTLVISTHCSRTVTALQRGSCGDPAMQDIAMLFQAG